MCLEAKLILGKALNLFALIEVMTKAFRPKKKLTVRDWGNGLIMFSFECDDDRQWVCKNQPCHFDGSLFAIRLLSGKEQSSSMKISTALFWVRVHDLSLDYRSENVVCLVVHKLGTLLAYEKLSDIDPSKFVRL